MEVENSAWVSKRRKTVIAAVTATIGSFGLGTVLAWTAPALPLLEKDPHLAITESQSSWIASLAILGALISAPVSGFLISRFGRKATMLFVSLPFTLGWISIALANHVWMIYVGRFVTGFCGGSFTVAVPAYIGEITEDRTRGPLSSCMILMVIAGIVFTYTIGAFLPWSTFSFVFSTIPILFTICFFWMPESPRYLLSKGNINQCTHALKWLRSAPSDVCVKPETSRIAASIHASNSQKTESWNWRQILDPKILKPICISGGIVILAQFSGINAIQLYTVDLFRAAGTNIDANLASIIIGGFQILSVFLAPILLVDRLGRKTLLIASELVMAISLIAIGVYFYIKEQNNGGEEGLGWLPLLSLVVFIIGFSSGMGPLPWLIMTELMPNHVKEFGSSIVTATYWISLFVVAQTFQDLAALLNWSGFYWLSAGICMAGMLAILVILPETKGKTAEELQQMYSRNSYAVSNSESWHESVGNDNKAYVIDQI